MRFRTVGVVSLFFLIISSLLYSTTWAAKSLEQLVHEFPVIVAGKVIDLDDDGASATAHLVVNEILKNRSGSNLKSGMFIDFKTLSPTSPLKPPGNDGYRKGNEGVWFLKYDSEKDTYSVNYPYSLQNSDRKEAVKALIAKLPAEEKPVAPLSIAVVIPKKGNTRSITCWNENSHFHVVLKNESDTSINLWEEWNSWGYFGLSFVVKDETGKEHIMKKKMRGWDKNAPTTVTLDPGDMYVFDVRYQGEEWEGAKFPYGKDIQRRRSKMIPFYHIKAVYEIREDENSKKQKVWTGRIESEEVKTAVYR